MVIFFVIEIMQCYLSLHSFGKYNAALLRIP